MKQQKHETIKLGYRIIISFRANLNVAQNKSYKIDLMKKRLSPLRKPLNYTEVSYNQDSTVLSCLSQLVQLQKKTIALLQNNPQLIKNNNNIAQNHFVQAFDHIKIPRQKPTVSLEGQIQRQQQLKFAENTQSGIQLATQSDQLLKQTLIKKPPSLQNKKYNVLNDFIPYTDRREYKIMISFESFAKDLPLITGIQVLELITIEWIGDVFRMVASMCWNMMLNGSLNYEEAKILFTQNIIYNYIEFMKELEKRGFTKEKHRLTSIINKKSISILEFLGRQYPQTKIDAPNIRLREILPNTNNSSRMKFDVMTIANRKGLEIKHRENANYVVEVMTLINFMIDEINQSYPEYERECLTIFEQIFKLPQKRIKPEDQLNKPAEIVIDSTQDIIYKEKVKKYTKFLIGRKINKNVPKYTRQEINNGVFYPKAPSILRIITKWVEELTEIIKNPEQHILSADKELKSHDGNYVILFTRVRQGICDKIVEMREGLFKKIQAINDECFYIESILSSKQFTTDETQSHLSDDQIAVGKFSVSVQKAISTYIFQQLNEILHFLLKIPFQIDVTKLGLEQDSKQSEIRKQLDKLNLVTMKVFDLLRCKCISNQQEIMWIMNYLIEKNNLCGDLKLIRVKDRLNLGTRDVNCNIRFRKNGLITEMQLSVASNNNIETKQQKLDSYNHFLYELKRSKLGPLSENVSIWTVLEQRSLYFQKVNKRPIPTHIEFHTCSNDNLQNFVRPICCVGCKNFYPYPEIVYSNMRCKKCKATYCGECYSKFLSDDDRKTIIFYGFFKQHALNHVKQHISHEQPFPLEGVYFKRYHERREINIFTVLLQSAQTKQFITFESIKQENKQSTQCTIIFTHNAIRNDKTVEKQKNTDKVIKGVIRNSELYIDKKDYGFFKNYLVFYFDQKFKPQLMTLNEIEGFLKKEENHGLKVVNIMEDPVYVDEIKYLRKKTQKLRELDRLKKMFETIPNQKFSTYQFGKNFIVAKAYKDSMQLGNSINYANNIAQIKSLTYAQKSIISMEKCKLKDEFSNIQVEINPKLAQKLYKNLRKLYLNDNSIETLQGLKQFVFLEILYIRNNNITSLKGIQGMKQLLVLRVDDNKITDLQPLKPLTALKRFIASDNMITSVEPLRNLVELRTIELERNTVEQLQPIKDLPYLEQLNFKFNINIKILPKFASEIISSIAFSQTSITDLSTLGDYHKISRLMLKGLGLKEIPSFIKNMLLRELWIGDNEIEQLTNLEEQKQLEILSIKRNKLRSLTGISHLAQVEILYLDYNQITSLEGLKPCFDTLKVLSLRSNPLDDVKLVMYADESLNFQYSKDSITQKAQKFLDELYLSKVHSSGSQD